MEPQTIICKAAVAFAPQEPFKIRNVLVAPPKAGEVRVKIMYAAPCHTDEYTRSGDDPEGIFPCILGHEASGIVESIGEGVQTCSVGDFVVLLYQAECLPSDREKKTCLTCEGYEKRKTNLCGKIRAFTGRGVMKLDNMPRFTLQGENTPVYHYMGVSAFSEYTVVHQESVAPITKCAPLDTACLLGCGIATGLGAVWKANVEKGSSVAVFGVGAVGLACIEASLISGASRIIAVDLNRNKESLAFKFGATDFLCPEDFTDRKIQDVIAQLFDGGVDFAFECTGNVSVMRSAFECTKKGWGVCVVLGVGRAGEEVQTRPLNLLVGRQWRGSAYGGWQGRSDMKTLVELHTKGKINLSRYVTHRMGLQRIEEAFDLLRRGSCIRCLLCIGNQERKTL